MRITESLLYSTMQNGLDSLGTDIEHLNQEVASGNRLTQPSDDPVASVDVVAVNSQLAALNQQTRNGQFWQGWITQSASACSSATDLVSQAKQLAVQMSNSTYSASERQSAAKQVDSLIEGMVSLGNTQNDNRYVFAGFRDSQPAFNVTRDASGEITAVTYAGDAGHQQVEVGPNSHMNTSMTGAEVFQGGADVFASLISLRDALNNNDQTGISGAISNLTTAGDNISTAGADLGASVNRIQTQANIISSTQVAQTQRLSDLQDADIVDVTIALQNKELAYQAALRATSTLQQLNLATYL